MGFQGQLSSVNLTDIFQTLHMNRQTGTLSVISVAGTLHVYFESGQIELCNAPMVDGRPFLINALLRKGKLQLDQADDLTRRLRQTGQNLRELVLASGHVPDYELDDVCSWAIEELVCPIFEWPEGDFTFTDGPPVPDLQTVDVAQMGKAKLQTTQLVMEATRRKDEWKRIREVITDPGALYIVDNDGRANLKNVQTDADMLKVLRYLDGRHSLDVIASTVGVTTFDTYAIVSQLILAGVARVQGAQEVVDDALAMREQNEPQKSRDLLENALRQTRIPEVMRPLAEVCIDLNQVPRAVELYLELIQISQDQGALDQALDDLDKVLGLSPDDPDLHFERAQVLAELGSIEDAARGYSTAAQAYLATKDVSQAIDACHRAKNLLPRAPEPHRFLARAYQLDGQTENAVVEYKSLWHALLTSDRPKKAFEKLKDILDQDCKYPAIKDQVLSHAQNSEAVKTSKATRVLIYALFAVVIIAGGVVGYEYWKRVVYHEQGLKDLAAVEADMPAGKERIDHPQLIDRLAEIRSKYSTLDDVVARAESGERDLRGDYEARAEALLGKATVFTEAGKYLNATATLDELERRYRDTKAARQAPTMRERVRGTEVGNEVLKIAAEATHRWETLDWDGAHAHLRSVLERRDLPTQLRAEVAEKTAAWAAALASAQSLYERAERIEQAGDRRAALTAYRRAAGGEGEAWVARSRGKIAEVERALAEHYGRVARERAQAGDDQQAFASIDEAQALARQASGREVGEVLAALELPFTLQVDHPSVAITVRRPGSPDDVLRAPAGSSGPWTRSLAYRLSETVTIIASRSGFTTQTVAINAAARRSQAAVALQRGPLWRKDLGGAATTAPILAGKVILYGTNRATIEVVDPLLGTSRPVVFPDTVAEFKAPPFLYQGRAHVVLDDQIITIDLNARTRLWAWPSDTAIASAQRQRLNGLLWVQEHELIQGQLLIFAGTIKSGLVTIAADQAGNVTGYPRVALENDLTGAPLVDHTNPNRSVLYVPAGNAVHAYDIAAVTGRNAPVPMHVIATRGDIIGRPVPTVVAGRSAALLSDVSGLIIAVDLDLAAPDTKRIVGSWPLEGAPTGGLALAGHQPVAYAATSDGRVAALDLARPGSLLWRFPAQGSTGPLIGAPAIGAQGIYVADGNGAIISIDAATGAERWRADLGSPVAAGIIAHDGRVYVPTRNGALFCFEEGD